MKSKHTHDGVASQQQGMKQTVTTKSLLRHHQPANTTQTESEEGGIEATQIKLQDTEKKTPRTPCLTTVRSSYTNRYPKGGLDPAIRIVWIIQRINCIRPLLSPRLRNRRILHRSPIRCTSTRNSTIIIGRSSNRRMEISFHRGDRERTLPDRSPRILHPGPP
jgi:hypothetical protein